MTQVPEEQEVTNGPATQEAVIPPELAQTEFSYSDHILYAQSMYQQPSWVVEGAFGPGGLDRNVKHTPAAVTTYLSQMMQQPDAQFPQEAP